MSATKEKRRPESDIPRRIYKSTIEAINKHINEYPREFNIKKKKSIKKDFNEFLEILLKSYEYLQSAKAVYVYNNVMYDDAMEARGHAIKDSVKTRKPVKWPDVYVYVGEDDES